jgi:hypothetical protein
MANQKIDIARGCDRLVRPPAMQQQLVPRFSDSGSRFSYCNGVAVGGNARDKTG